MFRLLHMADCGLKNLPHGGINPETGLNRRFEDISKNFKYAINKAVEDGCKYVVIAGDINEERNPESFLIEKFSSYIADIVSLGMQVIIIAGNHDVDSSKSTSTSVSFIKALGLVGTYVADLKPELFEFDDVAFHCFPYMFPHQVGVETNEELTEWLAKAIVGTRMIKGKPNVIVTHYSLESTFAGLGVDEPVLQLDALSRFDYVALGHIHKYEMFSSFHGGYTGSMFVKDFGEERTKNVNIVTFDGDATPAIKKIELPERKFVQFNIDARDMDVDAVVVELRGLIGNEAPWAADDHQPIGGAVVKVSIHVRQRFNPKLIYECLRSNGVFHHAPIDWKIERSSTVKKIEYMKNTDKAIVQGYFEENTDKDPHGKVEDYILEKIGQWDEVFT